MTKIGRNDACWCGSGKKYKACHLSSDAEGKTTPVLGTVQAGKLSPKRPVPAHIKRPEYADSGRASRKRLSCLKTTEDEIKRMRHACATARTVLDTVIAQVRPGVTTDELDRIAHEKTIELGAYPSPLNYQGYKKSICTSVNEVICHGIPDDRPLKSGEIVNVDVTVYIDGMHGDCSETVFVGQVDDEAKRLVATTYESMMKAIEQVRPGQPFFAIGRAIEDVAHPAGYSVVRDFTGHGIGSLFHMDPQVIHYFSARMNQRMEAGMTFTIEPMINEGTWRCEIWPDEWTAVTSDLKRSAQFEHTVLVTPTGYEILTLGTGTPWFEKQLSA
ncbi:MAG: type I methionyl aminopeptidase [bacterium]